MSVIKSFAAGCIVSLHEVYNKHFIGILVYSRIFPEMCISSKNVEFNKIWAKHNMQQICGIYVYMSHICGMHMYMP